MTPTEKLLRNPLTTKDTVSTDGEDFEAKNEAPGETNCRIGNHHKRTETKSLLAHEHADLLESIGTCNISLLQHVASKTQ